MTIAVQPSANVYFGFSPLAEAFLNFAEHNKDDQFIFLKEKEILFSRELPSNTTVVEIPYTKKTSLTNYYWRKVKLPLLFSKYKVAHFVTDAFPATNYGAVLSHDLSHPSLQLPLPAAKVTALLPEGLEENTFFLTVLSDSSTESMVTILKAFSIFKRRLHSGYILVFLLDNASPETFTKILSTYKYRADIVFVAGENMAIFQACAKACNAFLHFPVKQTGNYLLQNAMQENAIALVSEELKTSISAEVLITVPLIPEHIAEKMMLLYKDETLAAGYKHEAGSVAAGINKLGQDFTLKSVLAGNYNNLKAV